MTKSKTKTYPPAPDLVGPVAALLATLSIRDKNKIGEKVGTSITTVLNLQRGKGLRGPSHKLVIDLYTLLLVQGWRPEQ